MGNALESVTSKRLRRRSRAALIFAASFSAIAIVNLLLKAAQLPHGKKVVSPSGDGIAQGSNRLPDLIHRIRGTGDLDWAQATGKASWRISERTVGTCWSKTERHLYYHNSVVPPMSEALKQRLKHYEMMHARCVNAVSNWTSLFLGEAPPQAPGCKFIIPSCHAGLGNHFMSLLSAFVYALLTDRILLLPATNMRNMLCSPFPASDWSLVSLDQLVRKQQLAAPRLPQLMEMKANGALKTVNRAWIHLTSDATQGDQVFFCTYFRSNLEAWFPNRAVFGQLAPYLLHPTNLMWERITRTYQAYHAHADRRVGIQVSKICPTRTDPYLKEAEITFIGASIP